jgi:hypothetical protein
MSKLTVFVVGTGRCGTSSVARILHHNLQIPMGDKFCHSESTATNNPLGNFEDFPLYQCDIDLVRGKYTWPKFMDALSENIRNKPDVWGYKSPLLSYWLYDYLQFVVDRPAIIWCRRDLELCIESSQRCYGWTEQVSRSEISRRWKRINLMLGGLKHHTIDFTEEEITPDEEIEKFLRGVLADEDFDLDSYLHRLGPPMCKRRYRPSTEGAEIQSAYTTHAVPPRRGKSKSSHKRGKRR